MEMDINKFSYNNFNELYLYMDGSAGIVGEMMYILMNDDNKINKEINKNARDLGIAFQMTNFLRDILEDRNMNPKRVYFPIIEQKLFNINLENCNYNKESIKFINYQVSKTINYYKYSEIGINKLNLKYKKESIYQKIWDKIILNKIIKNKYNVFLKEKNNLTKYEKLIIIIKNNFKYI